MDRRIEAGTVSVVRGGKALLRKRGSLGGAGLTEASWRREWESARLFLTADGEKDKVWGNETIRWNPDLGWLEIKRTSRRRATPGAPAARHPTRNGRPREAQRQPPRWRKTATANRTRPPDQAAQDRSGPPATQDHALLAQQER